MPYARREGQTLLSDTDGLVSVRDLVLQKLSPDDRWNLALVQRAEVWDLVRMRHLLDSVLAGYPIGAILLCQVEGDSKIIRVEEGCGASETAIRRPGNYSMASNGSTRSFRC